MRTKLLAVLAILALLCTVLVGMTFSVTAEEERGYGMSISEWKDDYGQGKENAEGGIGIGADAHLKSPLYGESIAMDMRFTVLPEGDFWYVLAFANSPEFDAWGVHTTPAAANFYMMFQPGGTSMNVNISHFANNGSSLVKEDIALGPIPTETGLNATLPFTVEMSLFVDAPYIKITQGDQVCVYDSESHPQLLNVKKEQVADAYGRVYLNIAAFEASGALKELTFDRIETLGGVDDIRNWSGSGIVAEDSGVRLGQSALYMRAIDASSKYLKLTLDVKMIIGNVDAWVAIDLAKTSALPTANHAGLNIMMRNQGGKIAIQPELNTFGDASAELKLTDFPLGEMVFELYEEEGVMSVTINREPISNAVLDALTFADFTDENGYFYFGFESYVQGDQSGNTVIVKGITTDIKAKERIYLEVSGVAESGMVGTAIKLPDANVVQADGEQISATVSVTDPESNPVTLQDNAFTPSVKGDYTVVYSAEDSEGNRASETFTITVIDPDDALTAESLQDMNNWNAPYGGVSVVETGVQIFAHSYYKLPISMASGALRVSFNIDGLWDGNDTDEATSTDAWICIGFINKPAISAPGSLNAEGVYVRLNNRDGKLRVSVHYYSPFGAEDIAIEDAFASETDAHGPATIEIQSNGDGINLFVNGIQMRHENLSKIYYSDIIDANNCTYLAFSAYDNDDADLKLPNVETRCVTLTAVTHDKTEIVEDTTPPVIVVDNAPTTGTVGEKVILPPATITDDMDSSVAEQINVVGPDGKAVSVVNRSFTPQVAGKYTVTYTATDSSGNQAEPISFIVTVEGKASEKGGCGSSMTAANLLICAVLAGAAITFVIKRKQKD